MMHTLKYLILVAVLLSAVFTVTISADVELVDTDTETLGNWVGTYGENGAIVFIAAGEGVQHGGAVADEIIEGDIIQWSAVPSSRWVWENPADEAGESALLSIEIPDRYISGCAFSGDWIFTLEVELDEYFVAGYFLSGEVGGGGAGRSQEIWAYQGDDRPDEDPIDVRGFHHASKGGEPRYYVWKVDGPEPFHIDFHTLAVNAVISGIFVDAVLQPVEPAGKLTATWGGLKMRQKASE